MNSKDYNYHTLFYTITKLHINLRNLHILALEEYNYFVSYFFRVPKEDEA